MSQKLILPINKCKLNASWQTAAYQTQFKMIHYGVDLVSTAGSTQLYASGDGTIVATGNDSVLGNFIVVRYMNVYNNITKTSCDLICRMWHLASIAIKVGDKVTKDSKIGLYGNTGQYTTGAHLHLEVDTDVEHPMYTPTLSGKTANFFGTSYGANAKTMSNPFEWIHCKTDAPDNQTYTTANDAYIRVEDKNIVCITGQVITPEEQFEGIDVSVHNGAIDWTKVKTAKDFAFIRVGWASWDGPIMSEGGLDKLFHQNMTNAIAAGMNVGVYVYSYCKTPEAARIAAKEVLDLVKTYRLTYPIAFDIEDTSDSGVRYDKMTRAQNTAIVHAFLEEINKAEYYGILYTYKSFAENYLSMDELSGYDTWIAHYAKTCGYNGAHTIWQYNGDVTGFVGSCPGVTGACDLNVSYKDYAAFINNEPAPEQPIEDPGLITEIKDLEQIIIGLQEKIAILEDKLRQVRDVLK